MRNRSGGTILWLTDETISVGSWSYVDGLQLKTANEIIDLLADIVSKNGVMMLNISPMTSGIILQDQQEILHEIGAWLEINGEAIYGTRTWNVFGEGPTKQEKSGMFVAKISYTAQDIRYTQKGNSVYAIIPGWTGAKQEMLLSAFSEANFQNNRPQVKTITCLGSKEKIDFKPTNRGLQLTMPTEKVDDKAVVLKIELVSQ